MQESVTVPVQRKAPLEYTDFFILFMQSLAITASFIPMLLVGAYPMWVVFGVLAVQFTFWYNLNAIPKKGILAKEVDNGIYRKTDVIAKDLVELHKVVGVERVTIKQLLEEDIFKPAAANQASHKKLKEAYDAYNGSKDDSTKQQNLVDASKEYREFLQSHINALYLNKRTEYLAAKHKVEAGTKEFNKIIAKAESSFAEAYNLAPQLKETGMPEAFRTTIEGSVEWEKIAAKHQLKLHNNKTILEVFSKETHPIRHWILSKLFKNEKRSYSQIIEDVADTTGYLAAFLGNAVGCAGSGFMLTALLKSMPLFVTLSSLYAPILLTIALPITLAATLFICGYQAHFCNTVPAIKQIMKEFLYVSKPTEGKADDAKKALTKKDYLKIVVLGFSYFAAAVMACAISTINFLTGKFFGWLLTDPTNVLSLTTTAMATLAAPYTALGIAIGTVSALLTFIGMLCLCSKYVPLGVLGLFDNVCEALGFGDKKPESALKQEDQALQNLIEKEKVKPSFLANAASYIAIALFTGIATYFATASICFFVVNVLGPQFLTVTRACAILMYFNQSFAIGTNLFGLNQPNSVYAQASDFAKQSSDFARKVMPCLFSKQDNSEKADNNEAKENTFIIPSAA